jgi:hypothetical protein
MKAEIDEKQLLQLHPESLTERTALFAWWEALPADLRAQLKGRVLPFYENQEMPFELPSYAKAAVALAEFYHATRAA